MSSKRGTLSGKPVGQFQFCCFTGKGSSSKLTVSAMTQALQSLLKLSIVAVSSCLNLESQLSESLPRSSGYGTTSELELCNYLFNLGFSSTERVLWIGLMSIQRAGELIVTMTSLEQQHWILWSWGERQVTFNLISQSLVVFQSRLVHEPFNLMLETQGFPSSSSPSFFYDLSSTCKCQSTSEDWVFIIFGE